ncbi:hypothetical protein JOM56_009767 [Amanita muscaria]
MRKMALRPIMTPLTSPPNPLKTKMSNPPTLEAAEADSTLPLFANSTSAATLFVYLDTARPLSEPKWAKTGDVQDWLKSMFGRMFWVAGDAAEGWEKEIQVVDPDPPPTIWTVLEGWSQNSPVGALNERQRFLKTHMTETDNLLEILLRLVRGERATPFSQSTPTSISSLHPKLPATTFLPISGGPENSIIMANLRVETFKGLRSVESYTLIIGAAHYSIRYNNGRPLHYLNTNKIY